MTKDNLRTAIRGTGLRATHQRVAVLEILRADGEPLSHNQISEQLTHSGERSTLYRNLTTLTRVGLLRRIELGDRVWRFEYARGASHARQHPHFVCTECGVIKCLTKVRIVADRMRAPGAIKRGEIEIQVRGRCDDCIQPR